MRRASPKRPKATQNSKPFPRRPFRSKRSGQVEDKEGAEAVGGGGNAAAVEQHTHHHQGQSSCSAGQPPPGSPSHVPGSKVLHEPGTEPHRNSSHLLNKVSDGARHVKEHATDGARHVKEHAAGGARHLKEQAAAAKDHAEAAAMERMLRQAEKLIELAVHKAAASDPWMPREVEGAIDAGLRQVWPSLVEALKEAFLEEQSRELQRQKRADRKDLSSWPPPPSPLAGPLAALRARILYLLFPADKSLWWQLRQPVLFAALAVLLCPWGVSTVAWAVVLLWLAQSRDEYQVVNGILLQKSCFFFTSGLIPTVSGCAPAPLEPAAPRRAACRVPPACAPRHALRGLGGVADFSFYVCVSSEAECITNSPPGTSLSERAVLANCALQWLSSLGAFAQYVRVRKRKRAGEAPTVVTGERQGKSAAPLTVLVAWDAACVALVALLATIDLVVRVQPSASGSATSGLGSMLAGTGREWAALLNGSADGTRVRLWASCVQAVLGLLALPFVLLKAPGARQLVLRLQETAFDAAGQPRLKMPLADMKHKHEREVRQAGGGGGGKFPRLYWSTSQHETAEHGKTRLLADTDPTTCV